MCLVPKIYGGFKLKKALIIAVVIVIVIGGITLRFIFKQQEESTEAIASIAKPVEVIEARRGEIRAELQLSGTIDPNSQVMVFPEAAGKIITAIGQQPPKHFEPTGKLPTHTGQEGAVAFPLGAEHLAE